jgi:uncharacterized protein GlcG (DUF336 family)
MSDGRAFTSRRAALTAIGAAGLPSFAAGAIDLGSMSEIPPIFVAASRPSIRLIAVQKGDVNDQMVLVPKGSPITGPAQLKGEKVGYVRATTSHYLLLKLLAEQGLSFADITPIALSPQDGRAAFEHGSLDAWVAYGVLAEAVRGTVGARVLTTGLGRLSGNYLFAAGAPRVLSDLEAQSQAFFARPTQEKLRIIIDVHGNLVLRQRMNGAPVFSLEISERKAYTYVRTGWGVRTADLLPLVQPGQALYALPAVGGGRFCPMAGGYAMTRASCSRASASARGTVEQDDAIVEAAVAHS